MCSPTLLPGAEEVQQWRQTTAQDSRLSRRDITSWRCKPRLVLELPKKVRAASAFRRNMCRPFFFF